MCIFWYCYCRWSCTSAVQNCKQLCVRMTHVTRMTGAFNGQKAERRQHIALSVLLSILPPKSWNALSSSLIWTTQIGLSLQTNECCQNSYFSLLTGSNTFYIICVFNHHRVKMVTSWKSYWESNKEKRKIVLCLCFRNTCWRYSYKAEFFLKTHKR